MTEDEIKNQINKFLCTCLTEKVQKMDSLRPLLEYMYMKDGQHTSFGLLRCCKCKRVKGFPETNLMDFLQNGEGEHLKFFLDVLNDGLERGVIQKQ